MADKIAFVTYETPFAPAGGIAAVMSRLPAQMRKASGLETVVLTPYHHQIRKTAEAATTLVADLALRGAQAPPVQLLRHATEPGLHFLRAADASFFAGAPHPFRVRPDVLVRDALLFGAAVVAALEHLDKAAHWALLLQDWQAATAALASAKRAGVPWDFHLTLHNSYDSPVTDAEMTGFAIPALRPEHTILQRALPLVKRPIFTVSEQYAFDLTHEYFQSRIMADHLQRALQRRIVGINNGLFKDPSVDPAAFASALAGDPEPLDRWKSAHRAKALDALDAHAPTENEPVWGQRERFDRAPDACWFVMAGRDDPRQKGYDVAAFAARGYLESGGDARFFFFPVPGDEGLDGLAFLETLARDFPRSVLAFPFLWTAGFSATLAGAAYGLMPSFYEPFGMANEFYLQGTVGIGRATGGIVQQIVPLRSAASFSLAAQQVADRWHSASAEPTGLLFRERVSAEDLHEGWSGINAADYTLGDGRVSSRGKLSLFRAMATELELALADGARILREDRALYYRMLTRGLLHVRQGFSWERAAEEYRRRIG